jgi:hypothetical protein
MATKLQDTMTSYTVSPKSGYGGCLLFIAVPLLLLSCHVTRSVTTTHTNVDSVVSRVRDSSAQVTRSIEQKYQQRIQELVNSSVVFETQPCPDEAEMLSLLDSIGKINYRNMVTGEGGGISGSRTGNTLPGRWGGDGSDNVSIGKRVGQLTNGNRVLIGANGSIDATGRIKSVTVTNNKLMEELASASAGYESLSRVVDSHRVALGKKVDNKQVIVTKGVPWYYWPLTIVLSILCFVGGWWCRGRFSGKQDAARGG